MKRLYLVQEEYRQVYVVAENLSQAANSFPQAKRIEFICSTEPTTLGPELMIIEKNA